MIHKIIYTKNNFKNSFSSEICELKKYFLRKTQKNLLKYKNVIMKNVLNRTMYMSWHLKYLLDLKTKIETSILGDTLAPQAIIFDDPVNML